jgi:hypothetical protein
LPLAEDEESISESNGDNKDDAKLRYDMPLLVTNKVVKIGILMGSISIK